MFGLFKKKTPLEKLQAEYETKMKEAFELSKSDRQASDRMYGEANEIMERIDAINA